MRQEVRPVVSLVLARDARHSAPKQGRRSAPEDQHSDQDKCHGNGISDKVHPMDALTATKAAVFVIDIKTIPALHVTHQPRQKSKLTPKVRHSVPNNQPTCNRTLEPTNRWIRGRSCKPKDRQHAQEQIQQKQKQNINLSHPQRWPVPIWFRARLFPGATQGVGQKHLAVQVVELELRFFLCLSRQSFLSEGELHESRQTSPCGNLHGLFFRVGLFRQSALPLSIPDVSFYT